MRWSAALLAGCLDQGVEPVTATRATRLVMTDGAGQRGGAGGSRGDALRSPRRSVVIATGGFEYDADLVRDFLRGPMRAPGRRTDQHRRRPPDGDAGGCASSATCARPGGCRSSSSPANAPTAATTSSSSCASARCPARSWSTTGQTVHQRGGQLQRPRRRLPRLRPRLRSATSTNPAGWSSTRASSSATAASATRPALRCPTVITRAGSVAELAGLIGVPARRARRDRAAMEQAGRLRP